MKKVLFILIAIGLFIVLWLALKPAEQAPEATPVAITPQPIERQIPTPAPVVPQAKTPTPQKTVISLDASDDIAKKFITTHAQQLLTWLAPNELIRRFVINVNILSQGNLPADHLLVTKRISPFKAVKDASNGKLTADPSNAKRLIPLIRLVTQIPPTALVGFYQKYHALFDTANQELSSQEPFDDKLIALLDRIIACPLPDPQAVLKQESVTFDYQSKQRENAQPLKKALWRLGVGNLKIVQDYSLQLKKALLAERSA